MKQVVGKWKNKKRYLRISFDSVPARWSRWSLHSLVFSRPLACILNFFIPSNKSLVEFSWTHFPVNHNKWPSKRRQARYDTVQDQTRFQQEKTLCLLSNTLYYYDYVWSFFSVRIAFRISIRLFCLNSTSTVFLWRLSQTRNTA